MLLYSLGAIPEESAWMATLTDMPVSYDVDVCTGLFPNNGLHFNPWIFCTWFCGPGRSANNML